MPFDMEADEERTRASNAHRTAASNDDGRTVKIVSGEAIPLTLQELAELSRSSRPEGASHPAGHWFDEWAMK